MGKLTYGRSVTVDFDDRTLAHLQTVIGIKLRRNEAFYFTWNDDPATGGGRTTVWIHPTIPLTFKFYGSRTPALNRQWLTVLELCANTNQGLRVVDEPLLPPTVRGT